MPISKTSYNAFAQPLALTFKVQRASTAWQAFLLRLLPNVIRRQRIVRWCYAQWLSAFFPQPVISARKLSAHGGEAVAWQLQCTSNHMSGNNSHSNDSHSNNSHSNFSNEQPWLIASLCAAECRHYASGIWLVWRCHHPDWPAPIRCAGFYANSGERQCSDTYRRLLVSLNYAHYG